MTLPPDSRPAALPDPAPLAPPLAPRPGREDPSLEVRLGRWLMLGCACTLAVLTAAFLAFVGAVAWGVLKL